MASAERAESFTIAVGEVREIFENDEDSDVLTRSRELDAYVSIDVSVDGEEHSVGCMIGVPDWQKGSARASGCMASGPFLNVWWADASDWQSLDGKSVVDEVLAALYAARGRIWSEVEQLREEDLASERTKANVSSWETVTTYVATYPDGDEDGACDVEVQIGEVFGAWLVRTRDDAGGDDQADDTPYETEDQARDRAEAIGSDNHEGEDGEDAEAYLRRKTEERIGEPSKDGSWSCYWTTTNAEEERVEERYATRRQAEAAVDLANDKLHARNPGRLLCGYEVRELVDGRWKSVGDDC